jgi:molecular chaperone DnaJ
LSKRDYYDVLGVARGATLQDIKRAYRNLAVRHHPDRNPGNPGAEERFKEAAEAYQVLSDPEKRRRYDAYGHAGLGQGGFGGFDPEVFGDFGDILGSLFSDFFGAGRPRRAAPQRGDDLRYDMEIDFLEAIRGMETAVRVPRTESCGECSGSGAATPEDIAGCATCGGVGQVRYTQGFFSVSRTCPSCRGQGRQITRACSACQGSGTLRTERKLSVRIPPGVDEGSRLRLVGEGEGGRRGGPPGDLYVVLHVRDHPDFRRHGNDIHCRVPITFTQAALGATLRVPTVDGDEDLKIPGGTQSGTSFRLPGGGAPRLGGGGRGDQVVTVHVETPPRLTRRARELLRELAEEEETVSRGGQSLFERVRDLLG